MEKVRVNGQLLFLSCLLIVVAVTLCVEKVSSSPLPDPNPRIGSRKYNWLINVPDLKCPAGRIRGHDGNCWPEFGRQRRSLVENIVEQRI